MKEGNYDSVAKVGDFGLSVVMNGLSSFRREEQANFDPHYATPEQLKGQHYTTSSDIFAFGSILWELTRRKKVFHDVCFLLFLVRFVVFVVHHLSILM